MFPSFARLALVALLAVPAALAAGTPSPVPVAPTRVRRFAPVEDVSAINPAGVAVRALARNPLDAHLTNGQRLARGLPPRSPAFNTRRRALAPRQSATPCALSQATGTIRVTGADGTVLGYVNHNANSFGEYGVDADQSQALSVVLRRCDSNDVPFDIETINGLTNFPFFGAVTGFANSGQVNDIRADSINYVYVAGTSQVAHGPAQTVPNAFSSAAGVPEGVETAIWTSNNDVLTLNWVNTDGSVATGTLLYVPASAAFAYTGDAATFQANFGTATEVTFTFVPAA